MRFSRASNEETALSWYPLRSRIRVTMDDSAGTAAAVEQVIKSAARRVEWPDRKVLNACYHSYSNWAHGVSALIVLATDVLHPLIKYFGNGTLLLTTIVVALLFVAAFVWRKITTELAVKAIMFCLVTGGLAGGLYIVDRACPLCDEHGAIAYFIPAVRDLQDKISNIASDVNDIRSSQKAIEQQ